MADSGSSVIMSGNEAIARGALEAGISFCTSYPGTPSTEITETLMKSIGQLNLYAEWSTNEKVALEAAAGASWAGVPAICPMKSLGLNVAADFLLNVNLSGTGKGGLVIVVCDDPQGHSSSNEQDSRFYSKAAMLPMLEPASAQQAMEVMHTALDISRRFEIPVVVRSTTRLSHSRGLVTIGDITKRAKAATRALPKGLYNVPQPYVKHRELLAKLMLIAAEFEKSPLNTYDYPKDTKHLVISSGICGLYAKEALALADTKDIGLLRLTTTHPLPQHLITGAISKAKRVLFVEETDPFIEDATRALAADLTRTSSPQFIGKRTGTIPAWGEMNVDIVLHALRDAALVRGPGMLQSNQTAIEKAEKLLIPRPLTFCAGCTHRNVYWALRKIRKRLSGRLVVAGDIGCYSMGVFYDEAMQTMQAMGSGIGTACGLGQLKRFGFDCRVVAVAGDSTFFHACMPALVNAKHKSADITFLILDNATTAMTGFQTHPGSTSQEEGHRKVSIRSLVEAVEPDFLAVGDATDIVSMTDLIHSTLAKQGLKVLILNSVCRLEEERHDVVPGGRAPVAVNSSLCRGESCRICAAQYGCPAIGWDYEEGRPVISDELCVRCGSCIDACPHDAIIRR